MELAFGYGYKKTLDVCTGKRTASCVLESIPEANSPPNSPVTTIGYNWCILYRLRGEKLFRSYTQLSIPIK